MSSITKYLFILFFLFPLVTFAENKINIPILCYHNLNPTKPGSMNMTPAKFESQIKWIKDNGYNIIPLKEAVEYLQGKRNSLPKKSVVITYDDGWESVYTYLYPIVKKYKIPVTLFIYPGTIASGKNVLSWNQLKELQQSGYFEIEGHTFTHPNFKIAKRHLSPSAYEKFVDKELYSSKKILEEKLGTPVSFLAWPFGIYNEYLEKQAAKAGYAMAFTIDYRTANRSFREMAQPRYMIIDKLSAQTFQSIVKSANS